MKRPVKNLFDRSVQEELIFRIQCLTDHSRPQWGKMSAYQMIIHCSRWEEMLLGRKKYKQSFLGKLVGRFALKDMLKDEPVKHNLPTVPSFKVQGSGDLEQVKNYWISLLRAHALQQPEGFIHPFFGLLTSDQAGHMGYKHADHHLRQFNC